VGPNAGRPPPGGRAGAGENGGVEAQRSAVRLARRSDVERFTDSRERILGQQVILHRNPEIAAAELAEALGGRTFAHQWAKALLEATT
jgi:hypothetical protein